MRQKAPCLLILFVLTICQVAAGQDSLRIGSWNTANRPNSLADNGAFFQVIKQMAVPDIFAIQETDTGSSATLLNLFNQQQPGSPFSIFTTSSDSGGDRTGLVYNTERVQFIESVDLSTGLTHNTARATFLPLFSAYAEPVTVYSVHLNSGAADDDIRGLEATILASDAAMLGADNVLFAGDFNLLSSDEPAWTNIDSNDLANAPGDWRDNPDFIHLHTQNPGASLDDRFDFIFGSDSITDGVGFDYQPDSFTVFGNNGTHTLNGSIDTGTGASPDVLQSLITASDHLPIYADFQFISKPGDFDLDGDVDADDIDFYSGQLGQSAIGELEQLDLDADGLVTLADHDLHVGALVETSSGGVGTFVGDINLDGTVDVLDDAFILIGNLGNTGTGYAGGDLNADQTADVLGDAFRLVGNLGKSNGAGGVSTSAIPEPANSSVLLLALVGAAIVRTHLR
ncbi:hypothetical protein N9L06_05955 [Mariniblastus sp.]|nr:hypothetical protein [Mariniblastus sp.]